ncbi:MAG: type I-D CRISPR-associated protein Cas5/Csc1 [Candidatus Lokiarchaeota archaeon]|nr:type I-D CRISPR-associated protein Cas5/Csc1 [Candidatus Lokiarchaeota archaeon]
MNSETEEKPLEIYFVIFYTHDFLFFSHFDYNTKTSVADYVVNYALNYALNPEVHEIQRTIGTDKPMYDQDFRNIRRVATPALKFKDFRHKQKILSNPLLSDHLIQYSMANFVDHALNFQYNAIGESLLFGMEKASNNFPNVGSQEKFVPLMVYYCVLFGSKGPSIFRLGKKHCVCRAVYFPITALKRSSSKFSLDHAIEFSCIGKNYEIEKLNVQYSTPTQIATEGDLKGPHFVGSIQDFDIPINVVPLPGYYGGN